MDDDAELIRSAVTLDIIQRKLGLKSILSRYDANPKTPPEPAGKHGKRPAVARHTRKCNVCRHPEREAIEHGFLCWRSPDALAREYGIADHSSIYRHVHATGIFARRRANLRMALEPLIEQAESVEVTANAFVNAVRLYASINDDGQLIRPPTRHVVVVKHDPPLPSESPLLLSNRQMTMRRASSSRLPRADLAKGARPPLGRRGTPLRGPNRQIRRIEPALTHRKQTPATRSNRQNFEASKSGSPRSFLPRAAASGIVERRDE